MALFDRISIVAIGVAIGVAIAIGFFLDSRNKNPIAKATPIAIPIPMLDDFGRA